MTQFATIDLRSAALSCVRAGEGPPIVCIDLDTDGEPRKFHALLAKRAQVSLVTLPTSNQRAKSIAALIEAIGSSPTLLCRGQDAGPVLDLALKTPELFARLILIAPDVAVTSAMGSLDCPVLVLEGTANDVDNAVGQKMTATMPECYDVLVYDASDALDSERPEAVADVVLDFVERGGGFIVGKAQGPLHP